MTRHIRRLMIAGLILSFGALGAWGQTTQPAGSDFELHEWSVFVLDASQNRLNPDGFVTTTLPSFIDSRRQASPAETQNDPCPIGLIRLTGHADSKVDVRLEVAGGKFLSYWPKPQTRSAQLLWRDLALSDTSGSGVLETLAGEKWYSGLRDDPSDYLIPGEGPAERFLLFDVDIPYNCPLKVVGGSDHSMVVSNVGNTLLRDVRFYQPSNGAWLRAAIGDLAPPISNIKPTTQPAATQTGATQNTTTRPSAQPAITQDPTSHGPTTQSLTTQGPTTQGPDTQPAAMARAGTTQPSTTEPAATQASATQPAPGTVTVRCASAPATQPAELAADWKPALQQAGVSEGDAALISRLIATEAFDAKRMTVVYLLESAEYDRILPLEVVPEPRKVTRLGIVIIKNADPSLGSELDDLIVQLGDPAWSKRDAATNAILKFGATAIPKLEAAAKNKDLEIVWRAEKLVAELRKAPPG